MRMSDVLPDPLRPSTTQRSPGHTAQLTSSRILRCSRTNDTWSSSRTGVTTSDVGELEQADRRQRSVVPVVVRGEEGVGEHAGRVVAGLAVLVDERHLDDLERAQLDAEPFLVDDHPGD